MMLRLALVGVCLLATLGGDAPTPDALRAYEDAAAKIGAVADDHVQLALWCEAHGLEAERLKHLAIAVQLRPGHPAARGLLGQIRDEGRWRRPEDVAAREPRETAENEALTQYRKRRAAVPDTAEAHWQLATWCEEQGLQSEAAVHLKAVVRIDPAREEAWKKLGARKQNGRWLTAEQVAAERADADARRKADLHWRPLLQKWKGRLSQSSKRAKPAEAEAESLLQGVTNPQAAPSIWQVFAKGGPDDQQRAVVLLRQLDSPAASRAVAALALFGASAEVRRLAAEALAGRDPRAFADVAIGVLRDPVKYEVRPVAGPGSPGELYIQGKRVNRRLFYAAPPSLATLRPDDAVGFDENGLPVVNRVVGFTPVSAGSFIDSRQLGAWDLTGAGDFLANGAGMGAVGRRLGGAMVANQAGAAAAVSARPGLSATIGSSMVPMPLVAQVPVGRFILQAEQQAAISQQQLQADVAEILEYNKDVELVNGRALLVLKTVGGEDLGATQEAWLKWWSNLVETTSTVPVAAREPELEREESKAVGAAHALVPSLAGGTPVWTRSGLRPVEEVCAGDQVLTQDVLTGALGYEPVLTIRPARREPVLAVSIENEILVATGLERFWIAGKGWVQAQDLKPGDVVRLVGGTARVAAVDEAGARPVYHVQVDEKRGMIVGRRGALAHDGQVAQPVAAPFDAPQDRAPVKLRADRAD